MAKGPTYQTVEYTTNAKGECIGDEHILSWSIDLDEAIADADGWFSSLTPEEQKKTNVDVREYGPGATESDDFDVIYRNGAWTE